MEPFLSDSDKKEIAAEIAAAEQQTTGEIRVYLEKHCKEEVLDRAYMIFNKLKMHQTKGRTGVLIYIAHDDHAFAILGDRGIHEKVPENFWDDVKESMKEFFTQGRFVEGIKAAVASCSHHLKKHFPAEDHNPDELSNEVVIGEE